MVPTDNLLKPAPTDNMIKRCEWVSHYSATDMMTKYHDTEWGKPLRDNDVKLFELLTLEIFQAGLSWEISLKKRSGLNEAFFHFDVDRVASMTEADVLRLKQDENIIRNGLKIAATINNARIIQHLQATFGSLSEYLWHFTDNQTINHHITRSSEIVAQNALSQQVAKDMKKQGFKFAGPVTIYSYLQAMGVINDHESTCAFNPE